MMVLDPTIPVKINAMTDIFVRFEKLSDLISFLLLRCMKIMLNWDEIVDLCTLAHVHLNQFHFSLNQKMDSKLIGYNKSKLLVHCGLYNPVLLHVIVFFCSGWERHWEDIWGLWVAEKILTCGLSGDGGRSGQWPGVSGGWGQGILSQGQYFWDQWWLGAGDTI